MNIYNKPYLPLVDKSIRNHAIFRDVVAGKSCTEVGVTMRLGESRVRKIVQDVAFAALRHTRLTMTALPVQYSFPIKELVGNSELWLCRLESYEASLRQS